jgi:phasin family protein
MPIHQKWPFAFPDTADDSHLASPRNAALHKFRVDGTRPAGYFLVVPCSKDAEQRIPQAMIQNRMASVQPREASTIKGAPREAAEKPVSITEDPVVSTTGSISESITTTADTVAAVAEEMIKPITATKTTTPNPMSGMKTMIKNTEDFVALGQANMDAFVKSGQIWAAGVQELMKQFATTTKASFDESVSTFKAISSAKSVTEAIDLQSKFATSVVEKALAESNNMISTSIKLTEQTLAPITAHLTGAVETFGKAA